ncbi:MAG: hypothetical protein ACP5KN_03815, partial [Armatimonadota bacterium]
MTILLRFPKLSRFDRDDEPATVAVPFAEGVLAAKEPVAAFAGGGPIPTQARPTATWPDGSVKWLLVHVLADLPGNRPREVELRVGEQSSPPSPAASVHDQAEGMQIETGALSLRLAEPGQPGLMREVMLAGTRFAAADELVGPEVTIGGETLSAAIDDEGWR